MEGKGQGSSAFHALLAAMAPPTQSTASSSAPAGYAGTATAAMTSALPSSTASATTASTPQRGSQFTPAVAQLFAQSSSIKAAFPPSGRVSPSTSPSVAKTTAGLRGSSSSAFDFKTFAASIATPPARSSSPSTRAGLAAPGDHANSWQDEPAPASDYYPSSRSYLQRSRRRSNEEYQGGHRYFGRRGSGHSDSSFSDRNKDKVPLGGWMPPEDEGPVRTLPRFRYIVSPDNRGDMVAYLLRRRGVWRDAIPPDKQARPWETMVAMMEANDWNLVWKPSERVRGRCTSVTLHSLPSSRASLVSTRGSPSGASPAPHEPRATPAALTTRTDALQQQPQQPLQTEETLNPGKCLQIVNHLPSSRCITLKCGLAATMNRFCDMFGLDGVVSIPPSYVYDPQDLDTTTREMALLRDATGSAQSCSYSGRLRNFPPEHCHGGLFLLKPDSSYGGTGILGVTGSFDAMLAAARTAAGSSAAASGTQGRCVVQKAVEKPFLLNGRKFDIRVHVLVTDTMDVYVYNDGYLRTGSVQYVMPSDAARGSTAEHKEGEEGSGAGGSGTAKEGDTAVDEAGVTGDVVQLTNICVQRRHEDFGRYEQGNMLSFEQLQTYFNDVFGHGVLDVRRDLMPRWREIILDVVCGARNDMLEGAATPRRRSFQLFGFDFLLDHRLRSWLLEVNFNPGLRSDTRWAHNMMVRMVDEALAITVDPLVPPSPRGVQQLSSDVYESAYVHGLPWSVRHDSGGIRLHRPKARTPAAAERDPRTNGWELVYSEATDKPLSIPHQANMAENSMNDELRAALGADGKGPVARPTEAAVDGSSVPVPMRQSEYARLLLATRYFHQRSRSWLYPMKRKHK